MSDITEWVNESAEKAIIGIIISTPSETANLLKALDVNDFYFPAHKQIIDESRNLQSKNMPVDFVGLLTQGIDPILLSECIDDSMRVHGSGHILMLLKTLSMKRYCYASCQNIRKTIENMDADSPSEVRAKVMAIFDADVPKLNQDRSIVSLVEKLQDKIENEKKGNFKRLQWGMRDMDYLTGGLWGSELTILAAGPGTGKTAFALQVMNKIAQQGNVLFVSREMSDVQILMRMASNVGGIDGNVLKHPSKMTAEEDELFAKACNEISKRGYHIDCESSTIQEIFDLCRRMHEQKKLDLMIVDYMQLLTSAKKHENRLQEINTISRMLKQITTTLDIPVIALSQLNRAGQKAEPVLSDLRESGALEQDADNVIFLYNPKPAETEGQPKVDITVIIAKQRSGSTGRMGMVFDKLRMRFYGKER